ncbi:MAG: bifunctional 4-hydroxy-2-oxoglutarate aldolase/2-dehydro-3-deoxy-phosphogluconate aldolase [candidate division KSB1 bacterium]|nr:bifunctional 4-hydroxy-2-oxoglutarate aldolase/2-dehydro-3-deoxy-phosphogluconate aldolase [candidate division KSB1 bacterium]
MAQKSRLDFYRTLLEDGLVPLFYTPDAGTARRVATAAAAGGGRLLEFTHRGPGAYDVFKDLLAYCRAELPQLFVGVGSVLDAPTAALYIAAGADFIVAPIFDEATVRLCNRRKIAYIPGVGSVTEISRAEEWGVEVVKIFPGAAVGGPDFVKSVLGPMPWSRMMPTGGVEATAESIKKWFKAGVCAVGIGGNLVTKEVLAGDFAFLAEKVRDCLGWIREFRAAEAGGKS